MVVTIDFKESVNVLGGKLALDVPSSEIHIFQLDYLDEPQLLQLEDAFTQERSRKEEGNCILLPLLAQQVGVVTVQFICCDLLSKSALLVHEAISNQPK